ncbi:MAG: hypothetical protein A2901_07200 [Elusimicrobia bacterium RIFCSPLOWO2_01_FULL_54_10]|nr:MAG: hypothetical protein A2901_07200 [Elusimicrobia bacterium RIFCSPLOWO2_01_FULL_54_10]
MKFDITEFLEKLPPIPLPGMRNADSIGIDIGSSSIKIVQLKGSPGKYQLVRWSVIPILGTMEGEKSEKAELTPEEKKAAATNLLRSYRGSGKGIPKNAVSSVSGSSVIVRYVKFQKLTRKELTKTIKVEAEPYIPFNIEEVYVGFYPVRDLVEDGKTKMETVLVAAKQDQVNQRTEILEGAGFKPTIIDVDAFALESVYDASFQGVPPEETVLIANIGFTQTNFVIIDKGLSVVVKDSLVAGNSINKAVVKNLGTDIRTAEKLKLANGLLLTPQEKEAAMNEGKKEAVAVSNAISSVAKDLTTEIKKLIEFYSMQGTERQVNRVIVSGGSSNVKNLIPHMAKELNLPVERLNPFTGISGTEGVPEEYHTTLGVAVGLAMRRAGDVK